MEKLPWRSPRIEEVDPDAYEPSTEQQERYELFRAVVDEFERRSIMYAIPGGYGLDALYGKLTRDHEDIDVLVPAGSEAAAGEAVRSVGFRLDRVKAWGVEVYMHDPTATKLELASTALAHFPKDADPKLIFPDSPSGGIGGRPVRALTLKAHDFFDAIQTRQAAEKGWGTYKHWATRDALLERLRRRQLEAGQGDA